WWFFAAARTMDGPPMSIFSMHSSCPAPEATVSAKGYRLATTRSIGVTCSSSSWRRWDSRRRSARMPAWMRGCRVLTRPSRHSGNSVTSSTAVTGTPASAITEAVDPVETICTPAACRAWASSGRPVLSKTEIRARRTGMRSLIQCSSGGGNDDGGAVRCSCRGTQAFGAGGEDRQAASRWCSTWCASHGLRASVYRVRGSGRHVVGGSDMHAPALHPPAFTRQAAGVVHQLGPFGLLDPLGEGLLGVLIEHRDGALGDDRAGVHPLVDHEEGGAGDLHPVLQCFPRAVDAGEGGQEGVVRVQVAPAEAAEELRSHQFQ